MIPLATHRFLHRALITITSCAVNEKRHLAHDLDLFRSNPPLSLRRLP